MLCVKKSFYRMAIALLLATGFSFLNDGQAKSPGSTFSNLAPPDEKGPYNVGIRTFENVPMSAGRLTRVQVFYPTLDPPNCDTRYTVIGVGGTYLRSSPLCAVQNASVAAGTFPLVAYDHGGGAAGNDAQRTNQMPLHETMASHGFVVAVARHSANNVARVIDLPLVIDFMLAETNPLSTGIDPDRIGVSGFSAGGRTALAVAGGWAAQGLFADDRVKAMVIYEPGRDNSLEDISTISIPYLIMGGTRFVSGLVSAPQIFEASVAATPRIYVKNPEAVHLSYQTDLCFSIEETREAALLADPAQTEPLTNLLLPTNSGCEIDPKTGLCRRICNPAMGAAAFSSCTFWNQGELFINQVGFAFGGGRNVCSRIGTSEDSARSLDTHPEDGFTDAFLGGDPLLPLFEGNDVWNSYESTVELPIDAEDMVPMVKLYTIAFWKKFLEGDGRYMRYLTSGYANTQGLQAIVDLRE